MCFAIWLPFCHCHSYYTLLFLLIGHSGAVLDLENPSWLLLDGKLYVILFIVGDSVCPSLRCETEAGILVIVLVGNGKPLKAKVREEILCLLNIRLYFAIA